MLVPFPFFAALVVADRSGATWLPVREPISRDRFIRDYENPDHNVATALRSDTIQQMVIADNELDLYGPYDNTPYLAWEDDYNHVYDHSLDTHLNVFSRATDRFTTFEEWITHEGDHTWL